MVLRALSKKNQPDGLRQQGFSLVELAIAMAVIGLLLGATLTLYQGYIRTKAENDTETRKELIRVAIARFVATNGRLPCPADPARAVTDVQSGTEECSATGEVHSVAGQRAGVGDHNTVLIGSLPYAALNMSIVDAYDGWGSSFTYAVSLNLVDKDKFNAGHGVIGLKSYDTAGSLTDTRNPRVEGVNGRLANSYMFAVVSHGPDKRGAYTNAGRPMPACASGTRDNENCDGDSIFLLSPRSYASNSSFYDDAFVLTDYVDTSKDVWYQPGMSRVFDATLHEDILQYSTAVDLPAEGTVVLGHPYDTAPSDRLWVDSSVRSKEIHADQICDASGNNCYKPSFYGHVTDVCNGSFMIGISGGEPVCAYKIRKNISSTVSCPTGVKGYCSNGTVWCNGTSYPCP